MVTLKAMNAQINNLGHDDTEQFIIRLQSLSIYEPAV